MARKKMQSIIQDFFDVLKELQFSYDTRKIIRILSGTTTERCAEGNIVIANIRGNRFFLLADCILAHLFSRRGYKVFILLDDGVLAHNDRYKAIEYYSGNTKPSLEKFVRQAIKRNIPDPLRVKKRGLLSRIPLLGRYSSVRYALKKWISKSPDIRIIPFSSIVPKDQDFHALLEVEYRALAEGRISGHVDASHRRCFGGRPFDPNNELHVAYAKASAKNEYVGKKVAEHLIKNIKPRLCISLDGNYSVHGPLRDALKEHAIPVVIYRPDGFHDRTVYIGEMPYGVYNISRHWEFFLENGYDSGLRWRACEFLERRVSLKNYDPNDFDRKWISKIQTTRMRYDKVVIMFPNLTWDGAIKERDGIFNSLEDWLIKTIEWALQKNILLVIREHPQPLDIYHSFGSFFSLLTEIRPELLKYGNVEFIKGNEHVNSYYLVSETADCAVTYGGTLSIEIPYMGYPTIIAANSPYSNKDVAFEPRVTEEYFEYVSGINGSSEAFAQKKSEFRENAIRAAAYQFFYNIYSFPIMPRNKDWQRFKYTAAKYWQNWDVESLNVTENSEFKRTVERFLFPLNESCDRVREAQ